MLEEDYLRLPAPDLTRVPPRLAEEAVSLASELLSAIEGVMS